MIARREPDARGRDRGPRDLGNDAPALRAPISVSEAPIARFCPHRQFSDYRLSATETHSRYNGRLDFADADNQ